MSSEREVSRRSVLGGIVTTAAAPMLVAKALAQPAAHPTALSTQLKARPSAEPLPRYLHASVALGDGRILVTGGYHANLPHENPSNSAQIFDPVNGTWRDAAPMIGPRARHAAILLPDGRVAVLGGQSVIPLDSVEIYDPAADSWTIGPPLPAPVSDHTAVMVPGAIVLNGGSAGSAVHLLDLEPFRNVRKA